MAYVSTWTSWCLNDNKWAISEILNLIQFDLGLHVPHAHTFAVMPIRKSHGTAPFGIVECDVAPSMRPQVYSQLYTSYVSKCWTVWPLELHKKVFGSSKSSVGSYLKIGLHFIELYNSRGCRQMRVKVVKMKFIFSISAKIERIIKTFLF